MIICRFASKMDLIYYTVYLGYCPHAAFEKARLENIETLIKLVFPDNKRNERIVSFLM